MMELLCALMLMINPIATTQRQANVQDSPELLVIKSSWNEFTQSQSTEYRVGPYGLNNQGMQVDADPLRGRTNDLRAIEYRLPKPQKGFAYKVKLKNSGTKTTKLVFWEYQFSDPVTSQTLSRRQFLCAVKMKPGSVKGLEVFSISPPSNVVSVASLTGEPDDGLSSKIVINRVIYTDGSSWQRSDWSHPKTALSAADLYPGWGRIRCHRF